MRDLEVQAWELYMSTQSIVFLILNISEISDNMYIRMLLEKSESFLLVRFVKYTLQSMYSYIQFLVLLEAENSCLLTKQCSKYSYICVFILPKQQQTFLLENFHNLEMVGDRKLHSPPLFLHPPPWVMRRGGLSHFSERLYKDGLRSN